MYSIVATGGTFDIIHDGHIALLAKSFEISEKVIIGLTSDELAAKKGVIYPYAKRLEVLTNMIQNKFPNVTYEISKLDNDFGPAIFGDVQGLVVSEETKSKGAILNDLRAKKNLPPVDIITVPLVLAKDGLRISTTRIKNSEIDPNGNILTK